jgi:hypothetical protein
MQVVVEVVLAGLVLTLLLLLVEPVDLVLAHQSQVLLLH